MSLLEIQNLHFRLSGTSPWILRQCELMVEAGDFIILLGTNGSGKSTLLKLIQQHYKPHQGRLALLDQPYQAYSSQVLNQMIKLLNQNCDHSLFTNLTIFENYLILNKQNFFSWNQRIKRASLKEYLSFFSAALGSKLDCQVAGLSGGQKQVLALAWTLLKPPKLLLLDEHTSALDPKSAANIMQLTQTKLIEHDITCILTTHDLDIALQYGNRLAIMHAGKISYLFNRDDKKQLTKNQLLDYYI